MALSKVHGRRCFRAFLSYPGERIPEPERGRNGGVRPHQGTERLPGRQRAARVRRRSTRKQVTFARLPEIWASELRPRPLTLPAPGGFLLVWLVAPRNPGLCRHGGRGDMLPPAADSFTMASSTDCCAASAPIACLSAAMTETSSRPKKRSMYRKYGTWKSAEAAAGPSPYTPAARDHATTLLLGIDKPLRPLVAVAEGFARSETRSIQAFREAGIEKLCMGTPSTIRSAAISSSISVSDSARVRCCSAFVGPPAYRTPESTLRLRKAATQPDKSRSMMRLSGIFRLPLLGQVRGQPAAKPNCCAGWS